MTEIMLYSVSSNIEDDAAIVNVRLTTEFVRRVINDRYGDEEAEIPAPPAVDIADRFKGYIFEELEDIVADIMEGHECLSESP